jgi:hypothetical protein
MNACMHVLCIYNLLIRMREDINLYMYACMNERGKKLAWMLWKKGRI